jgi:hypothetical protein
VRGCMNIPLSYVIREHDAPTQEMFAQQYAETDDRYVALFLHAGGDFQQDNKRVWDLLAPLLRGTAAWKYIKTLEPTKNGRRAFKTLMLRGGGKAAVDARRVAAEMAIRKAQYTGKSKRFTIQSYINVLQSAYNDLEACGEPYTEKRKVE